MNFILILGFMERVEHLDDTWVRHADVLQFAVDGVVRPSGVHPFEEN